MPKTYVYMDHSGMDFYLSECERTAEETYCPICECSDELVGVYEEEDLLAAKLKELFRMGYDLVPSDKYTELKEKYFPQEF